MWVKYGLFLSAGKDGRNVTSDVPQGGFQLGHSLWNCLQDDLTHGSQRGYIHQILQDHHNVKPATCLWQAVVARPGCA